MSYGNIIVVTGSGHHKIYVSSSGCRLRSEPLSISLSLLGYWTQRNGVVYDWSVGYIIFPSFQFLVSRFAFVEKIETMRTFAHTNHYSAHHRASKHTIKEEWSEILIGDAIRASSSLRKQLNISVRLYKIFFPFLVTDFIALARREERVYPQYNTI